MTIRYGTSACERIICGTRPGERVGFAVRNAEDGTEAIYALHPVTREIAVRRGRVGADESGAEGWREAHFIPAGAAYVGRCGRPSDMARVTFAL